jgi:hypothetical protein
MFRKIVVWFKNLFSSSRRDDINRMPTDDHMDDTKPDEFENNPVGYRLWLPSAENIMETENIKMRTRGEYAFGYPRGLVVHFTAGWHIHKSMVNKIKPFPEKQDVTPKLESMARDYALRTARYGVKNGFNFLVMDILGNVYQSRPMDKWGYHAGKSFWQGLGYSVSQDIAGVEILNVGRLTKKGNKYYSWFDLEIPAEQVRYIEDPLHGEKGYYCMFTAEQEESLKKLIVEMRNCSPVVNGKPVFEINNVVGHHEISPKRKNDPSGALSMPMSQLRHEISKML